MQHLEVCVRDTNEKDHAKDYETHLYCCQLISGINRVEQHPVALNRIRDGVGCMTLLCYERRRGRRRSREILWNWTLYETGKKMLKWHATYVYVFQ